MFIRREEIENIEKVRNEVKRFFCDLVLIVTNPEVEDSDGKHIWIPFDQFMESVRKINPGEHITFYENGVAVCVDLRIESLKTVKKSFCVLKLCKEHRIASFGDNAPGLYVSMDKSKMLNSICDNLRLIDSWLTKERNELVINECVDKAMENFMEEMKSIAYDNHYKINIDGDEVYINHMFKLYPRYDV